MSHYIIYDIDEDKFLRVTEMRDNFIDESTLIENASEATAFHHPDPEFTDFINNGFVIDTVNYLRSSTEFKDFIFCTCRLVYTPQGKEVLDIDYANPLLICNHLDPRFDENITFK